MSPGVTASSVILFLLRPPFGNEDAELVDKLDLPAPVKRMALWVIRLSD